MQIILADLDSAVKPWEASTMGKKKTGPELLREWRGNRTQPEAAEILGCTFQQVSHWETGFHRPEADRRFEIERLTEGYVPASSWS